MRAIAVLLIGLFVAACNDDGTTQPATQWNATLAGTPAFAGVSGTATASVAGGQTVVTATLAGAQAGSVHPWHIHFGTCADDQGIVGGAAAYPHLQAGAEGQATATATVNVALQAGQAYFINVHASPQNLPTIVACGALTRQ
jgi:Cu/Zn superoxide dismutase